SRLNARFNLLSVQQKCDSSLKVCAVNLDVTVSQAIEHSLRRMMERIVVSNRDHTKARMNRRQQFRGSRGGAAMMRYFQQISARRLRGHKALHLFLQVTGQQGPGFVI